MASQTKCSRIKKIEVFKLYHDATPGKMSLRPDFDDWFGRLAEYKQRGEIRKKYAIRSSEFFDGTPDQWESMMKRLPDRLGRTSNPEFTVIEGSLKLLENELEETADISEIIFERRGKPYFLLDNTKVLYPSDKHIVLHIDLDKLIDHCYISKEEQETNAIEKARWKIIEAGAVFITLSAILTYIGEKI